MRACRPPRRNLSCAPSSFTSRGFGWRASRYLSLGLRHLTAKLRPNRRDHKASFANSLGSPATRAMPEGSHLVACGFGFGERIDHPHAGASKPVLVAADHGQIVNKCRRRQQGIEGGHRLPQAHTTPLVGNTLVHRQDAISKLDREALEPFTKPIIARWGAQAAAPAQNPCPRPRWASKASTP